MSNSEAQTQLSRPALAPLVAGFYVLSAGWTVLSFVLIKLGLLDISSNPQAKLKTTPTAASPALTLLAAAAECYGAVAIWQLRKTAFLAFFLALAFTLLAALGRLVDDGLFAALGGAGVFATLFGWGILAAVCAYTWQLIRAGVLA